MEAKRRKIAVPVPREAFEATDLETEDVKKKLKALKILKDSLKTAAAAKDFNATELKTVIGLINGFKTITDKNEEEFLILQYCLSIFANCCNLDVSTCLELKQTFSQFPQLAVTWIENPLLSSESKSTLCRLVANLCAHKETAHWISSQSLLVDRICILLTSENALMVKQCLRTMRNLVSSSFTRALMLSNAGYNLGQILPRKELQEEIIKILQLLFSKHKKDLDRQLANSICAEQLVEMFFEPSNSDELRPVQRFIIEICTSGVCVNEMLGTEEVIDKLLENDGRAQCWLLATFSKTASGRARLRTSGALDVLIERFSKSGCVEERQALVNAFRHFIHDTVGMSYLAANKDFVNTIVRDVNSYLDKFEINCQPTVDAEFVMKLSSRLEDLNHCRDSNQTNESFEASQRLHKDFHALWAYETAPTFRQSLSPNSYSQYSSPNSSIVSALSPTNSTSRSMDHSDGSEVELCDVEGADKELEKCERAIIESELYLLMWQSQDDTNLTHLIRPNVIDCIISYLRKARRPEFRTYRVLRRMATSRGFIEKLLDLEFHTRVLTGLCAVPCRLLRYAKKCKQCEKCAEHGREVLREFASHVDSDFGHAFLVVRLEKSDFVTRTKAIIANVVLIRDLYRTARLEKKRSALGLLFATLARMLASDEQFDAEAEIQTFENGPSLCSQIVGAMSSLVSERRVRLASHRKTQKFRELSENDSWYFPPGDNVGDCKIKSSDEAGEKLLFLGESGALMAAVPMGAACSNSLYFEGMFSSEFSEKRNQVRQFRVDEAKEECPSVDFQKFLHFLAGCTSSCIEVQDAETCASLLQLTDRYLCPRISTSLCAFDGPLKRFLNGKSLHFLLPAALSLNLHQSLLDTAFLVLVRFADHEDVTRTMRALCGKNTISRTFITKFRDFLSS